jgi:leucine dehydrogenase
MEDMEQILTETRWVTGISPAQGGGGDPSPVTAFGVLQGMKAAAAWQLGNPRLAGCRVAIQGLGSVGFALARHLTQEEGAKVLAADLDPERTGRARAELGVEIVAPGEILEAECDVLAPCALGAVLDDHSIPKLRCKIVAGAANNQLADEERHGQALHDRGILYVPDFVVNAGGLINVYSELTGYNRETALRMAGGLFQSTTRIFELSRAQGIPTAVAAHRVAEDRIASVKSMRSRFWARKVRAMRGAPV